MLITQPTDAFQLAQPNQITLRQIEHTNAYFYVLRLFPRCTLITRPENALKIVLVETLTLTRTILQDFA